RHHDDINGAEIGEMPGRQRVMQMPEMGEAQIGDIEHKDRVAVVARAPRPTILAHIGRHVVDLDIAVIDMMRRDAARRVPAAQHKFDAGLDRIGVMRRMRVVHRHDVGRYRRADHVVVIGDDRHALRALNEKARMPEKIQPDAAFRPGRGQPQPRPLVRHRPAARRHPVTGAISASAKTKTRFNAEDAVAALRTRCGKVVVPAKAGTHLSDVRAAERLISAFGGMTYQIILGVLCASSASSAVKCIFSYSTTSTRNGPGEATASAKRRLNSSIFVTRAPGTPRPRATPTQSMSGRPRSSMSSAFRPGLPAPTLASSPFRI